MCFQLLHIIIHLCSTCSISAGKSHIKKLTEQIAELAFSVYVPYGLFIFKARNFHGFNFEVDLRTWCLEKSLFTVGLWSNEPLFSKIKSAKLSNPRKFSASNITRYTVYVLVNVQCRGIYDCKPPPDHEGEAWFTVINPEAL